MARATVAPGPVAHAAGAEPDKLADIDAFESFVHELEIDGEMQADTAILRQVLEHSFPWSRLSEPANPSPPVTSAARLERISPYMLEQSTTSKLSGLRTRKSAAAST